MSPPEPLQDHTNGMVNPDGHGAAMGWSFIANVIKSPDAVRRWVVEENRLGWAVFLGIEQIQRLFDVFANHNTTLIWGLHTSLTRLHSLPKG